MSPVPVPAFERVMQRTDTSGGCWLWTGRLNRDGYAEVRLASSRRSTLAHRVVYEELVGPIPNGFQVDHRCHTDDRACPGGKTCSHRRCMNPAHLEAVTPRENSRRSGSIPAGNLAKTHCKHGHEFTPENTYHPPKRPLHRSCKTCVRTACRRYNQRLALS